MENKIAFYPSELPVKKAVTLVAHGLNQKPEAMLPLISLLAKEGSDVYLVRLSGHRNADNSINTISALVWENEMLQAYAVASEASSALSRPLFFLGYSLGALLAQSTIVAITERTAFDKQVLLAPAIALRSGCYLLKLLFPAGMQKRVPSFSPAKHRVHNSLPLLVYDILFKEEQKVKASSFGKAAIATLLVIDPQDEMVSYKKLLGQINLNKLSNYRIVTLKSRGYHHLIVDEPSMGAENWIRITNEITAFLFGNDG